MDYKLFTHIALKLLFIVALIGFIFFIVSDSKTYSCDKCILTLKSNTFGASVESGYEINIKMEELYKKSKEIHCPIYWDRVEGYVKR